MFSRRVVTRSVGVACLILLCGCEREDGASGEVGKAEPLPELLVRADLQRLVDAGLDRRTAPLLDALTDPDVSVRATAAYVLASVQDSAARPALRSLLRDPHARVRREAAFALGQLRRAQDGPVLIDALEGEADPAVRLALFEAIGKVGDGTALADLLARVPLADSPEERLGVALSLYHFGRRGVTHHTAGRVLLELVAEEDARQQAVTAALALAAPREVGAWGVRVDDVRRALRALPWDRPAAGPLLGIVARSEDREDLVHLRQWLEEGEPWSVRVAAARALGVHAAVTTSREAVGALVAALDDPSPHVATTAATALAGISRERSTAATNVGEWLESRAWADWIEARSERPSVAAALLPGLIGSSHEALILDWARGELGDRFPRSLAWSALSGVDSPTADSILVAGLLMERREAYTAAAVLAERLLGHPLNAPVRDSLVALVSRRLTVWGPHAPTSDVRGVVRLVRELASAADGRAVELLQAAADHPHPALRRLAEPPGGRSRPATPGERRQVDWRLLAEAGTRPRLAFETTHGTFVVELYPEAAPLAVSSLLSWAATGKFDHLTFHRVEPDFVLQSGDFENEVGSGGPMRPLRSEFTHIRFAPGVLGMASAGKDTEGSQYFIAHDYLPSLDGRYGAVGRVVSGLDVAEAVALGDSVLSVRPVGGTARTDFGGRPR